MHIYLHKWLDELSGKLKQLSRLLPRVNDEENLFEVELCVFTAAYAARKIGENTSVPIVVNDDDGERTETVPSITQLSELRADLFYAIEKTKKSAWSGVSVSDAFDVDIAVKHQEQRDLSFICDRLIHAIRFDTGNVKGIGLSLLFASDNDLKESKLRILPVEAFLDRLTKFAEMPFIPLVGQGGRL